MSRNNHIIVGANLDNPHLSGDLINFASPFQGESINVHSASAGNYQVFVANTDNSYLAEVPAPVAGILKLIVDVDRVQQEYSTFAPLPVGNIMHLGNIGMPGGT